jgi:trans-2-enoyl-CoA reductase
MDERHVTQTEFREFRSDFRTDFLAMTTRINELVGSIGQMRVDLANQRHELEIQLTKQQGTQAGITVKVAIIWTVAGAIAAALLAASVGKYI